MPFTYPFASVLCPFCFEKFHLGEAPVRVISSKSRVNDPVVRDFLGLPLENETRMAPVEYPTGFWTKTMRKIYFPSLQNGKESKRRICPHCHMELPIQLANGNIRSNIIAVVGFRDSGKSNFFGILIDALKNRYSKEVGLNLHTQETFDTEHLISTYSDDLYTKRYGQFLLSDTPKTVPATRTAQTNIDIRIPLIYRLNLKLSRTQKLLHPRTSHRPIDLVLFDAAGEDMSSPATMDLYGRYFSHAKGIIALIDPLSYPEIRRDIKINSRATSYQSHPYDTIGVLIQSLQAANIVHCSRQKFNIPLAVAISKFDMLRNIDGLDPVAFEDHFHNNGFNKTAADKTSDSIRTFFSNRGINSLISNTETNFHKYHYFGMSALGRAPEQDRTLPSVEPINVADPLLWILNQLGYLPTEDEMKESNKWTLWPKRFKSMASHTN